MTKNMISDLVVSWVEQASEDMRCSLAIFERGGWSNSSLMAQQCAEKMSKAILIHAGKDLVHTHNMSKLTQSLIEIGLIGNKDDFMEPARALNQVFWMSRYPQAELEEAPYKAFSQAQAELAIEYGLNYYDLAMHIFGDDVKPILLDKRNEIQQLWETIRPKVVVSRQR